MHEPVEDISLSKHHSNCGQASCDPFSGGDVTKQGIADRPSKDTTKVELGEPMNCVGVPYWRVGEGLLDLGWTGAVLVNQSTYE